MKNMHSDPLMKTSLKKAEKNGPRSWSGAHEAQE